MSDLKPLEMAALLYLNPVAITNQRGVDLQHNISLSQRQQSQNHYCPKRHHLPMVLVQSCSRPRPAETGRTVGVRSRRRNFPHRRGLDDERVWYQDKPELALTLTQASTPQVHSKVPFGLKLPAGRHCDLQVH